MGVAAARCSIGERSTNRLVWWLWLWLPVDLRSFPRSALWSRGSLPGKSKSGDGEVMGQGGGPPGMLCYPARTPHLKRVMRSAACSLL